MQLITVIGALGKDAEAKTFGDKPYTVFNVAASEKQKDGTYAPQWYTVYSYGHVKYLLDNLKKGVRVCVSGTLQAKVTESNGKTFLNLNINSNVIEILRAPQQSAPVEGSAQSDDGMPF